MSLEHMLTKIKMKRENILIGILAIGMVLISGCIEEKPRVNESANETLNQTPAVNKTDKSVCTSSSDCACGADKETGDCAFGNKEFIDVSVQCPDFCSGIAGHLELKCIENRCIQVVRSEAELNYKVSGCNESWTNLTEKVDVKAYDSIKISHDLPYTCCANITLDLEREGNSLKIIETNIGEVCRCMCGYHIDAEITGINFGKYALEIWGVKKEGYDHYKKIYEGMVDYRKSRVCIGDNCFYVELVATPYERARGLMFRKHMDPDSGMLFIFEEEDEYPFWMKNTLIPLDMIWINKDREVVFIGKNVQPCESGICPMINPGKKAMYVLELNGGVSDKIGLSVGDKVTFDIN